MGQRGTVVLLLVLTNICLGAAIFLTTRACQEYDPAYMSKKRAAQQQAGAAAPAAAPAPEKAGEPEAPKAEETKADEGKKADEPAAPAPAEGGKQ